MGRKTVDSSQVFFDALPVPEEDRIGDEGGGYYVRLTEFCTDTAQTPRCWLSWKPGAALKTPTCGLLGRTRN